MNEDVEMNEEVVFVPKNGEEEEEDWERGKGY